MSVYDCPEHLSWGKASKMLRCNCHDTQQCFFSSWPCRWRLKVSLGMGRCIQPNKRFQQWRGEASGKVRPDAS